MTPLTIDSLIQALFGSLAANRASNAVRERWEIECERWLLSSKSATDDAWQLEGARPDDPHSVLATALAVLILETPYRMAARVPRQ